MRIGSVLYNRNTGELVSVIPPDTLGQPRTDVPSRWLSIDPLAHKFAAWSPYNFVMNNPVYMVDPDGRAPATNDWKPDKEGNLHKEKGDNEKTLAAFFGGTKAAAEVKALYGSMDKSGTIKLDNNMSRSIARANADPNFETISDVKVKSGKYKGCVVQGSYNCYSGTIMATNGTEITGTLYKNPETNKEYPVPADSYMDPKDHDNILKTNFSPTNTPIFGKTILRLVDKITGLSDHAVVSYGVDKSGERYFYSKNNLTGRPSVLSETELYKLYPNVRPQGFFDYGTLFYYNSGLFTKK